MGEARGVTLRAQWLGQMLRDLREDKRLTLREAGEYLQRTGATISRFETGVYPIRRVDAAALLDLYGVEDPGRRDTLLQLAGELWHTGWWETYSKDAWSSTIDLAWLENRALTLRTFAGLVLPGLLQTRDYILSLFQAANSEMKEREIERAVELRLERQRVLVREEPVRLSAIIDEAALRRPIGGAQVMVGQLKRLREAAELSNVDIRVIPFSRGAHASPEGSFTLIGLEEPFSEIAHTESAGGAIYLERGDVDRLIDVYDRLQESSLSVEESAAFIVAMEKDLS
ncbi:transcriptional regulator with XRE-family HTH domain [Spinactinospora alkalitolerans]|uniref:Transcriptional regulator with XRE-family HTH domain n=1 Tax=Spinactinospora alkalitolerans TaxID=687207 RepID=A0A852U422_9ACTN|nr:helix-turn-helix transcriptional regulator [Spinactinospora alkalitolerans]NYE48854.1 transcriptional regulator with XRE-family HTH domain [Spinactinospora alkalitolerans]